MTEQDDEEWARKKIEEAGGLMAKWVWPGRKGPPDDIVFWPGRRIDFIELKFDVNNPDPVQLEFHKMLARLGVKVKIARGREWWRRYIEANSVT